MSHGIDQLFLSFLLIMVELKSYNICPHTAHVSHTHECPISRKHSNKMKLVTWSELLAVYKANKIQCPPILTHLCHIPLLKPAEQWSCIRLLGLRLPTAMKSGHNLYPPTL